MKGQGEAGSFLVGRQGALFGEDWWRQRVVSPVERLEGRAPRVGWSLSLG